MRTNRSFTKSNDKSQSAGLSGFLSKFSQGLMIPIAVLPIAGLFLGIGSGLINIFDIAGFTNDITNTTAQYKPGLYVVPGAFSTVGDVIFANLPVLFGIAAAIAFTKEYKGVAAMSTFILWIVMNVFQGYFLNPNIVDGQLVSYDILFFNDVPTTITAKNLGILSLQTSVFGGLTCGFIGAWLTNTYGEKQMPKLLEFFSGTRLVPVMAFLFAPVIGAFFILTWPWLGIQINKMGAGMANMPFGLNSLMYGLVSRSLLPFGLHHAFYTPLWFTSVGMALYPAAAGPDGLQALSEGDSYTWFEMINQGWDFNWINYGEADTLQNYMGVGGDVMVNPIINPDTGITVGYITQNAKPGMYIQGYPDYIFGLTAAGAAMIAAAPKGKGRELAISAIGAAAFTSFLTGVTEPIQYTFLFVSPLLYVFHVIMFGMANWWMNLMGANIGVTFSGGAIDWVLYGIVPAVAGFHTRWWAVIVVGILEAAIYFPVFYFYIVKKDIPTPGREGGLTELVTKADYKASKAADQNNDEEMIDFVNLLGGVKNIKSSQNCATRLRLIVLNEEIIKDNESQLKTKGVISIVYLGKGSVQLIIGPKAEMYNIKVNKILKGNK